MFSSSLHRDFSFDNDSCSPLIAWTWLPGICCWDGNRLLHINSIWEQPRPLGLSYFHLQGRSGTHSLRNPAQKHLLHTNTHTHAHSRSCPFRKQQVIYTIHVSDRNIGKWSFRHWLLCDNKPVCMERLNFARWKDPLCIIIAYRKSCSSKHIIKSAIIDGDGALAESSRLAWQCKVITCCSIEPVEAAKSYVAKENKGDIWRKKINSLWRI